MFSYREFSDAAHQYRKKFKVNYKDLKQYEEERLLNQTAYLKLTLITESKKLCNIYSQLEALQKKKARTDEDHQKLFYILGYCRYISENYFCNTFLDEEFSKIDVKEAYPIQKEVEIVNDPNAKDLPLVYKLVYSKNYQKVKDLVHETFISIFGLNALRKICPNFTPIYGLMRCSEPITSRIIYKNYTWPVCKARGDFPVMAKYDELNDGEYVTTLYDYLSSSEGGFGIKNLINTFLQVFGALQIAFLHCQYTNYDLHSKNILLKFHKSKDTKSIDYPGFSLKIKDFTAIVADHGMSYIRFDKPKFLQPFGRDISRSRDPVLPCTSNIELFPEDKDPDDVQRLIMSKMIHFGSINNGVIGVKYDRPYPLGDIFRLFFDVYSLCTIEEQKALAPLVQWFFSDGIVPIDGIVQGTSNLNTFSIPPFNDEFYAIEYKDFIKILLEEYGESFGSMISLESKFEVKNLWNIGPKISQYIDLSRLNTRISIKSLSVMALIDRQYIISVKIDLNLSDYNASLRSRISKLKKAFSSLKPQRNPGAKLDYAEFDSTLVATNSLIFEVRDIYSELKALSVLTDSEFKQGLLEFCKQFKFQSALLLRIRDFKDFDPLTLKKDKPYYKLSEEGYALLLDTIYGWGKTMPEVFYIP